MPNAPTAPTASASTPIDNTIMHRLLIWWKWRPCSMARFLEERREVERVTTLATRRTNRAKRMAPPASVIRLSKWESLWVESRTKGNKLPPGAGVRSSLDGGIRVLGNRKGRTKWTENGKGNGNL